MSWLRIDDAFASHPKIAALSDRELRVWLRVLCYCSRHEDPTVDRGTMQEVPGLTSAVIQRLTTLALLDPVDEPAGVYEVHDWTDYRPKDSTGAERQKRWRQRHNAPWNGRKLPQDSSEI